MLLIIFLLLPVSCGHVTAISVLLKIYPRIKIILCYFYPMGYVYQVIFILEQEISENFYPTSKKIILDIKTDNFILERDFSR